jgi:hypothetical protein
VDISAKFQFEEGKFSLSVYTAEDCRAGDAEHNTLMELKGEPDAATWNPDTTCLRTKRI